MIQLSFDIVLYKREVKTFFMSSNDTLESCTRSILPIRDALYILNGKWKLPILFSLMFDNLRFNEMEREIKGITPKMLAKELCEVEQNLIIKKNACKEILLY